MMPKKLLIAIFLLVLFFGCLQVKENNSLKKEKINNLAELNQENFKEKTQFEYNSNKEKSGNLPVLKNLAVNFGAWNPENNAAGDFVFAEGFFGDKIFVEFGAYVNGSHGGKLLPEITYWLPKGTKVFSPVDGKIQKITLLYSKDYDVQIKTNKNSEWIVSLEHLENIKVKEGQEIKAGDILGDASVFGERNGFSSTELVVWKGGATEKEIIKLCPFSLLEENLKSEYKEKIIQLATDWEKFTGKDIYNENSWVLPACLYESLTEFEALNPLKK